VGEGGPERRKGERMFGAGRAMRSGSGRRIWLLDCRCLRPCVEHHSYSGCNLYPQYHAFFLILAVRAYDLTLGSISVNNKKKGIFQNNSI